MRNYKKVVAITLCVSLLMGTTVFASENVVVEKNRDKEMVMQNLENKIRERKTESYILIKDEKTGEESRIELGEIETNIRNCGDYIEATEEVDIEESLKNTPSIATNQNTVNTISEWKGTVKITYTDDGQYACLKSTTGGWTKVSGSYNMTNKRVTYGQNLGTNSKNGTTTFGTSFSVNTGFAKGKYGSGHFLGANIAGQINGKTVSVVCNHYL